MNSTALTGSIAMSNHSSERSILVGVLFVSSQTTKKSYSALCPTSSNRKLSVACLISLRVILSLGSNKNGLTNNDSCLRKYATKRATLILSNADAFLARVYCPKLTIPAPGIVAIGLILTPASTSRRLCGSAVVLNSPFTR